MKKALILAAGVGKRLGTLTKDIPKCLLPIGNCMLIDFSLDALRDNNVKEIVFVTGYAFEKLEKHISEKWADKFSINFIFNEQYSEYNNIYSAYLAKDLWDDETVLLNSDIIYHPSILKNLKSKIEDCKSYLVIDDKKQLTKESMKVKADQKGEIKEINKNLDIKNSLGEYIGITYLRGFERVKFIESLEKNVVGAYGRKPLLDLCYEDALGCILNEVSVFPCSTEGKPWTEIDTKEDYEVAKSIVKEIKLSEGCSGEEYPERHKGKGKIAFEPRFFRDKNESDKYSI